MLCLGITGGIGSGKSYVSHIFSALGVPVYEADSQARSLYERNDKLRLALIALLGSEIYQDGVLQREVMASKIFSNRVRLAAVNRLVHPAVMLDFSHWKEQQISVPYVIMESAIILETPFASAVDRMLTVSAPVSLRLERLCRRDAASVEDAQKRMGRQWSDAKREERANYVVHSDGKRPLLPQVLDIHQIMCGLSRQKDGGHTSARQ